MFTLRDMLSVNKEGGLQMSHFSERLKSLRQQSSITQAKLADDLNVTKSLISMYESGQRLPSFEMLEAIADYFNVPLSSLVDNASSIFPDMLPVTLRRVPILGGAACGEPIYAPGDGTEFVTVEDDFPCDFALIAEGDSMIGDRIHSGDIVFIRSQDHVQDGEIAAVALDNEVTLKHVRRLRGPDGNVVFTQLLPSNPAYSPIDIGGEDETRMVRVLGKAVAVRFML